MPRKDLIHDAVKNALIKDGWTITDDPFRIVYQVKSLPLLVVNTDRKEVILWIN